MLTQRTIVVMTEIPAPLPEAERNFLDHYFGSVYNRLEADALLFNRRLPHHGLAGAENENALAQLLREFLPPRFGIDVSAIVIDRHGGQSRQIDIVIYDAATYPRYLRKIYPVETGFATIEVKTTLRSSDAEGARSNLKSVFDLDFRPEARQPSHREQTPQPPLGVVFAFRSDVSAFETYASWFPFETVLDGFPLQFIDRRPEVRGVLVGCLDKGILTMTSNNLQIMKLIAISGDTVARAMPATVEGKSVNIDPAKCLFQFLETLWQFLAESSVHPAFDIRSYMSNQLGLVMTIEDREPEPVAWYVRRPERQPSPNGGAA